jgi:ubiquitin C-terminal hydrolase
MFLNSSKIFIEEDEIPIKDNEELLNEEIILISENKFTIREQIDIIKEKIKDTNEKISDYQLNFKLAWSFHCAERLYNLNTQEQINHESNYYNRIRENIPEIDLLDLLEKFGKLEQLTEDNKWFCPKCKIDQLAKKKIEIFTCP